MQTFQRSAPAGATDPVTLSLPVSEIAGPEPLRSAKEISRLDLVRTLTECEFEERYTGVSGWGHRGDGRLPEAQLSQLLQATSRHLALFGLNATYREFGSDEVSIKALIIEPGETCALGKSIAGVSLRTGYQIGIVLNGPGAALGYLAHDTIFIPWTAVLNPDRPIHRLDATFGHEVIHALQEQAFRAGRESFEQGALLCLSNESGDISADNRWTGFGEFRAHRFNLKKALSALARHEEITETNSEEIIQGLSMVHQEALFLCTSQIEACFAAYASLDLFKMGGPITFVPASSSNRPYNQIEWVVGYCDARVAKFCFPVQAEDPASAGSVAVGLLNSMLEYRPQLDSPLSDLVNLVETRLNCHGGDPSCLEPDALREVFMSVRKMARSVIDSLRMPAIEKMNITLDATSGVPSVPATPLEAQEQNSRRIRHLLEDPETHPTLLAAALRQAQQKYDAELAVPAIERLLQAPAELIESNQALWEDIVGGSLFVLWNNGASKEAGMLAEQIHQRMKLQPLLLNNVAWAIHTAGTHCERAVSIAWEALESELVLQTKLISLNDIIDTLVQASTAISKERGQEMIQRIGERLKGL